jgi:hypothetical protein
MPANATYTLGGGCAVFEALLGDDWIVSDDTWRASPVIADPVSCRYGVTHRQLHDARSPSKPTPTAESTSIARCRSLPTQREHPDN